MTVSEIMDIWPVAQYLAANDIPVKRRRGYTSIDITLPMKIYSVGKSVQRIFDDDPADSSLTDTANYLYALCGKYGLQAQVVNQNSGVIASTTTITSALPLPLDFIVSASSTIPTGGASVVIPAFIGYNIEFTRGAMVQYTTNPGDGSTYYNWDRTTGTLTLLNGDAQVDERFRITPIG